MAAAGRCTVNAFDEAVYFDPGPPETERKETGVADHRGGAPDRSDGLKADKLGAYGIWGGLDPDERGRLGVRS